MRRDFNIDEVGKKVPYHVPDAFFEQMQKEVLERVAEPKKKNFTLLRLVPIISAVAAVFMAVVYIPIQKSSQQHQTMSQANNVDYTWVEDLSDEDLETINSFSEYDIFMK